MNGRSIDRHLLPVRIARQNRAILLTPLRYSLHIYVYITLVTGQAVYLSLALREMLFEIRRRQLHKLLLWYLASKLSHLLAEACLRGWTTQERM